MFDVDAYVLSMLQHDDRKLLKEIDKLKADPPQTGEPTLHLTLARYENNPFLLYSCLYYSRQQGIAVRFAASNVDNQPSKESKIKPPA